MSKFNPAPKGSKTVNYEGADAYQLTPQVDLYSAVVTSSLEPKFYESAGDRVERVRNLVKKNSPEFVAKLAVYTREKMYLRSMPLVLAVELARIHKGDSLVSKTVERVVKRADELTELLAYYQLANKRTDEKKLNNLSKQIQKGLANAFNNFDEYQFAKYNRDNEIKIRDVLFLVHPHPKSMTQQLLFDKIVNDTLEVPYTWEVELSELGQNAFDNDIARKDAFKGKWEELIKSDKLGYMAMLRNLRNFIENDVGVECMEIVADRLADPNQVLRSRQFPFRFLSAYRSIKGITSPHVSNIVDALEKAIAVSIDNVSGFSATETYLIASDVSGSMSVPISRNSTVQNYDIGLVLGMLARSKCKSVATGIFGSDWKVVNLPQDNILANSDHLDELSRLVGWATNGWKVIADIHQQGVKFDKVMMFTDMQLWDTQNYWGGNSTKNTLKDYWNMYKRDVNPDAKLYIFDLAGYGNSFLDTNNKDVFLIAGWSEKVFDVLDSIENGESAISEINKIDL